MTGRRAIKYKHKHGSEYRHVQACMRIIKY